MAKSRAKRAKAPESGNVTQAEPQAGEAATAPEASSDDHKPASLAEAIRETPNATEDRPPVDAKRPIVTPDPRPIKSASIGEGKGSPRMQLLRSHRFKQMQIRFDRQPEDHHLMKLKEAGWKDRTEEEGIWTKQVAPGEWKPVADAERLFKVIANAIREEKGLEPVLQGQSVA